ncbi:MAG: hypothetical protein E4H01_13070 [Lysobacterales bacterium]|nr:MAG: hypothetical protein E4H01_13070 [Xanthomonadales bacterium]
MQTILERRVQKSAMLLRKILGPITLTPTKPEVGRPYYRAHSNLDVLAVLEEDPESDLSDAVSNCLRKWGGGNRLMHVSY